MLAAEQMPPSTALCMILLDPVVDDFCSREMEHRRLTIVMTLPIVIIGCTRQIANRGNFLDIYKYAKQWVDPVLVELSDAGHLDFCDEERPSTFLW